MIYNSKFAKNKAVEQKVKEQLLGDFDEKDLNWIDDAKWQGPREVPLKDIDFSNEKSWRASHEQEKVEKRKKKIKNNDIKPILLVKTPKNKKFIIIDGHHRALAYKELDKPVLAWIGHVDREDGPWDTLHNKQHEVQDADKKTAAASSKVKKPETIESINQKLPKHINNLMNWSQYNDLISNYRTYVNAKNNGATDDELARISFDNGDRAHSFFNYTGRYAFMNIRNKWNLLGSLHHQQHAKNQQAAAEATAATIEQQNKRPQRSKQTPPDTPTLF